MINCVITDWIMAALQKYEKQYRIKEFRTVLHPQTTEKDPPNNYILESKAYFDWLFPNLSDSIKMSNLRRKPLHSYYIITTQTTIRSCRERWTWNFSKQ